MRSISRNLAAALVSVLATASANAQPRTDADGDPLPAGAIARLGSARFAHGERLVGLSLSPEGAESLGADDHHIYLWDTATGRELREFKGIGSVMCAALSPDGKRVAASENGPRIWIWDAKTGRELCKTAGKTGSSSTIAWSADSKSIATYDDDRVNLWDAANGALLHSFKHKGWITRLALSPDGKFLVTGNMNEDFHRVWDIASEKELRRLPGAGRGKNHFFTQDGKTFVGYCEEKRGNSTHCSLRCWDIETGKTLRDIDHGPIGLTAFAPGGKTFCATKHNFIRVYDFASGAVLREWKAEAEVGLSSLSGDGKLLAGDIAGRIRFWNPETGKEVRPPTGHRVGVLSVSFATDGKCIASGSKDGTVRIWEWPAATENDRQRWHAPGGILALQYGPKATIVILDSEKGRVRVWNPETKLAEKEFEMDNTRSFELHPDGKTILTSDWDKEIGVWNREAKGEIRRIKPIEKNAGTRSERIESFSLSPDGRTVAWAAKYAGAGIVDFATGKTTAGFKEFDDRPAVIEKVLFAPDGMAVATTGTHGHLQIWSSKTGERTAEWEKAPGQVLAYSPDGRFIAVAKAEIAIWDVAARKELIRFAGHRG